MNYLTDAYLFPVFQISLVLVLAFTLLQDAWLRRPGVVRRAAASIRHFEVAIGFAVAVVTLFNGAALKDGFWLQDYSLAFNLLDVAIILYLGFFSPTFRNWLVGFFNRRAID